jgi:hypothetical protein
MATRTGVLSQTWQYLAVTVKPCGTWLSLAVPVAHVGVASGHSCHGIDHWNKANGTEICVNSRVDSSVARASWLVFALEAIRIYDAVDQSDHRRDALAGAVVVGDSCVGDWSTAG